jgi:serine/threonine-protein kinase
VVLFELLTGGRPFASGNSNDLKYAVLNEPPLRATQLNPDLPIKLDAILDKALDKALERRFQNASEFIAALESLLQAAAEIVPDDLNNTRLDAIQTQDSLADVKKDWNPQLLEQATKQLSVYLGPIAKLLTRKAAAHAHSPSELLQHLMAAIPNQADSLSFRRQMQSAATDSAAIQPSGADIIMSDDTQTGGIQDSFDQALLEAVRQDLAVFIGPIAKVLVKRTAAKARTAWDLYQQLAEYIPTDAGRTAFLKRGKK